MALKNVFIALVLACVLASHVATAARELSSNSKAAVAAAAGHNLAARLDEAGGGLIECWNALNELKSCTNEIVLFFINGQTDIGPDCCRAIEIITRNCWPAMLTSLGFTPEEGNILRGYCDASSGGPAPGSTAAPYASPPVSV
ncbi:hypothetical protein CCACVL1_26923 [Corchorus capsularis]|uniref:Prolamin-like domain-containing protein n=1 Tax=Corchorus capsularis TaxID=210143 RepID=A0A1R3GD21_COCAP|nr:hypothetical protein CCACVL1_26923 [Corchorus capsularis]